MRHLLPLSVVAFTLVLSHSQSARAQQLPPVQIIQNPLRSGDTTTPPPGLPLDVAMMPLRIGLLGDTWLKARVFPGCEADVEAGTNSQNGFALQRTAAMRLVPRLTLVGFSRAGCQVDAALGGGLVYSALIKKDFWFVGGVGVLGLPHAAPAGTTMWKGEIRADLMFRESPSRMWNLGLRSTGGGVTGLSFGGLL